MKKKQDIPFFSLFPGSFFREHIGFILRGIALVLLVAFIAYYGTRPRKPMEPAQPVQPVPEKAVQAPAAVEQKPTISIRGEIEEIGPKSPYLGRVLRNIGYVSYFSEEHGIPVWVGYLTKYPFAYNTSERPSKFIEDNRVRSPKHSDYTRTGYDRGHMAPNYAIGRTYGEQAQMETFYMTNIVPQRPNLNRKQWCDLEQWIANDLAKKFGKVLVFVGPVMSENMPKLGKSRVSIPSATWMVILVKSGTEYFAVGFVIPQNPDKRDFKAYIVSVDEVERITGLDFFPRLTEAAQARLESRVPAQLN